MLVTGNGVVLLVEDEDDLFSALFNAIFATPDSIEDTIAEHALDTICFLQDADVSTPMDERIDLPWMITLTDMGIE